MATVAGLAGCTDTTSDGPGDGVLRAYITSLPEDLNLNPWDDVTTTADPMASGYWEVPMTIDSSSTAYDELYNGDAIDLGHDETEAVCLIDNIEIDSPTTRVELAEGFTFWDGTEIDAHTYYNTELVRQYGGEDYWVRDIETTWEVIDDYTLEYTYLNENYEPEAVHPDIAKPYIGTVVHPDFIEPFIDRYENEAENLRDADEITADLEQTWMTPRDAFENEWGHGPFVFDPDDWDSQRIRGELRDDYPMAEEWTFDELVLEVAPEERLDVLVSEADLDILPGRRDPAEIRSNTPESIQILNEYPSNANKQLIFNQEANDHLANRSVRQAIVSAVPWQLVGLNGFGEGKLRPTEHYVNMPDPLAEQYLDEDFLDSLFDYPVVRDFDQAAEFMEAAGYEKDGDTWVDPDGEPVSINIVVGNLERFVLCMYTVQQNLQDFGFEVQLETVEYLTAFDRIEAGTFDMALIHWDSGENSLFDYYQIHRWRWSEGAHLNFDYIDQPLVQFEDGNLDTDMWGAPIETEAPVNPSEYDYVNDEGETETVNVVELCYDLQSEPNLEEATEILEALARHANYNLENSVLWATEQGFLFGNTENWRWPEEDTLGATINHYDRHEVPGYFQPQD